MNNKDFDTFSSRLKNVLETLKMSQSELARRINVTPQTIQYLCSGKAKKSDFTLSIAEALDIDFVWLATGRGNIPNYDDDFKIDNSVPILSFDQIKKWQIDGIKINLEQIQNRIFFDGVDKKSTFAVEINDTSMAPSFDLKTIVIIEPVKSPEKDNIYILVHLFEEDFIIFRKLSTINNTKYLIAMNKNLYKDIPLNEKDKIIGVCKEARWSI